MCGIIGYIGKKKCKKIILEGLSRLEYRGYDSAGFVCIDAKHKRLSFVKAVGKIATLEKALSNESHDGMIGIGHTRWATHGAPAEENAHPQFSCTNELAVVHNGIIEQYHDIRRTLVADGHQFLSQTDTEVAAHLLESLLDDIKDLKKTVVAFLQHLHGIYAFVFILQNHPDILIAIRHKSPLSLGFGDDENYVASDPIAFSDKTRQALYMPDDTFAIVRKDGVELYDFSGNALSVVPETIDVKFTAATKQGFEHFMLKEIYEQKQAIDRTVSFYTDDLFAQLGLTREQVRDLKTIQMVAAGTSWHAGRIAQFFFENVCNIPANVHLASEFRYNKFFPPKNSLFIFISQSGETADTLECLRMVNEHNIATAALTNVASSSMVREAGGFLLMQAGPEISVASTKAFTCQLASLYWLAHRIAQEKWLVSDEQMKSAQDDILLAAEALELSIENYKPQIIKEFAPYYKQFDRFLFLGRHISHPFAMEAALKLKEVSYIFAQPYAAGELKHGSIALIDERTPVVLFSVLDELIYQKLLANAQEVKARGGNILAFAFEGQQELIELADKVIVVPRVNPLLAPLAMAGVMQFLVYHISKELGVPIDKPRNLAKSVTVE